MGYLLCLCAIWGGCEKMLQLQCIMLRVHWEWSWHGLLDLDGCNTFTVSSYYRSPTCIHIQHMFGDQNIAHCLFLR